MSDTTEDRSKYIRTYAKDVAALTGASTARPDAAQTPAATPPVPPPAKSSAWGRLEKPIRIEEAAGASEAAAERAAVLARLRAKLDRSAQIHIEESAPPPPPPALPPPKPVFAEPPAPPPLPMPPVPPKEVGPSPLHTYTSDFADHIDKRQASTFSVLAAESDAAKKRSTGARKKSLVSSVLATLLFVIGGVGIAGAYWYVMKLSATPLSPLPVPSLVFADERMKLSGTGPELLRQLADAASEPLVDGNVLVTYLSESTTTAKGEVVETPLAGGALIRALQLPAPDIFLRNVSPASTVGIISAGVETRPFFVFRVTSYERTFAGMLAWEETVGRDLALLYPSYGPPSVNEEAPVINLGTSTPVAASEPAVPLPYFTDAVVASHDVRVLKDTRGNTLMLYGYADKATLILARDAAAFAALIPRLTAGLAND